jgi:pimeloyl-ACP methyl ester carboxylesterase
MPGATLEFEVQREKSLRRWVKRLFWTFVALLALVAVCGAAFERISEHLDQQRFPQAGRSVNIGRFNLNLNCSGSGKPTVILESGLGIPAIGWQLVQPGIANFARVCSYDRAGYGWSEPGPFPRTSREIALELHALLQAAHVAPPYVLVGHSFGGFNVRLFNFLYPSETVGFVLVDSSQEDQETKMRRSIREENAKELRQLGRMQSVMGFLIDFGIARAVSSRDPEVLSLPANLRQELTYLRLQKKYADAVLSEESSLDDSVDQVRGAGNLDSKPLIVLTAGESVDIPGVPKKDSDQFFADWIGELQPRLARLSRHSRQIVLLNSHHLIPFEQPQAIVDAAHEVIADLKAQ